MPTVLRADRFQIVINSDDHQPPHVHVIGRTGRMIITLAVNGAAQGIRRVNKQMSAAERRAGFRLVAENTDNLYSEWVKLHGK